MAEGETERKARNDSADEQRELLRVMSSDTVPQARYDAYCRVLQLREESDESMRPEVLPYGKDFGAVTFEEFVRWEQEQKARNEQLRVKHEQQREIDKVNGVKLAAEAKESLKLLHASSGNGGSRGDMAGKQKNENKGIGAKIADWFKGLFGG